MDVLHRLFVINFSCRVLTCTHCQHAVAPAHVDRNIRAHHKRLTLQQHRHITVAADKLLIPAEAPSDVVYFATCNSPIANLTVYFDDLK